MLFSKPIIEVGGNLARSGTLEVLRVLFYVLYWNASRLGTDGGLVTGLSHLAVLVC